MPNKKLKWKIQEMNHLLRVNKDFYISFNPNTHSVIGISAFDGDNGGCPETALCRGNDFFILNGDYRKEYEKVISKGFNACKKIFDKFKKDNQSSWSD